MLTPGHSRQTWWTLTSCAQNLTQRTKKCAFRVRPVSKRSSNSNWVNRKTPQVRPCSCACQKRPDMIFTKASFIQSMDLHPNGAWNEPSRHRNGSQRNLLHSGHLHWRPPPPRCRCPNPENIFMSPPNCPWLLLWSPRLSSPPFHALCSEEANTDHELETLYHDIHRRCSASLVKNKVQV